jgi:glycosyltransferase involved in cell wall biosynthesis
MNYANRKRVAAIVEYFPPRLGGDSRIYELLERLPSEEYEVTFIALPPSYTLFMAGIDREPSGGKKIEIGRTRGVIMGYPRSLLRLWRKSFILAFIVSFLCVLPRALMATIRISPDLIIVNNTSVYTGLTGYLLSVATRRKLLVDFNDLESEYTFEKVRNRVPQNLHGTIRLVLRVMENLILSRSSNVIVVHTQFLRKYAESVCRKRILYVPDGVDVDRFRAEAVATEEVANMKKKLQLDDARVCVYAGRIDKDMGGQLLYKVIQLLQKKCERTKCLILGEGDPDLVERIAGSDIVVYLGSKPRYDVPRYIALGDVVLVPFPPNKASESVSPLKLFEGLAMAKPVIASNVSGIRDVIVDGFNGILVDSDPDEWVVAIRRVLNEDGLANRLARNALATARNYDWRVLSEEFEHAIEKALEAGEDYSKS